MFLFVFNVYKVISIFVTQIFIFVYNSLISVMSYKVYNELPGVGNGGKTLKSVIYYNMYNMTGWTPGTGANGTGRNSPSVPVWRHQEGANGAGA